MKYSCGILWVGGVIFLRLKPQAMFTGFGYMNLLELTGFKNLSARGLLIKKEIVPEERFYFVATDFNPLENERQESKVPEERKIFKDCKHLFLKTIFITQNDCALVFESLLKDKN